MQEDTVDVPEDSVGLVIGRAGNVINRLIKATGCRIEVPRNKKANEEGLVQVQLKGTAEQCRLAADAIKDIIKGGDAEDHAARAEGALVMQHDLQNFDREAWVAWRLVATEKEFGVKVDMGRRALRVWATGGKPIVGAVAQKLRAAAETAITQAQELIELVVDALIEHEPDGAMYDRAVAPLVDQYGVKIWVPRPEGGTVPIKIVGPDEPARACAALFEARYVKGKFTASVLQVPGQVQSMAGEMSSDYENDIKALESEFKVKLTQGHSMLWIAGNNAEAVANARQTIRDMLLFYFPTLFFLRKEIHPSAVEWLRSDEDMRLLRSKAECVIVLDEKEGSAWIAGPLREQVQKRIEVVLERFSREHWEMDLEDYGVAMWLLGPKGSGDFLHRMQVESGAKIKVCPNALKAIVEGKEKAVADGKRLILDGLKKLEEKKAVNPVPPSQREMSSEEKVDSAKAALAKFHHMLAGRGNTPSPERKGKGSKGKGKRSFEEDPADLPASRSSIVRASDIFGASAGPRGPASSAAGAAARAGRAEAAVSASSNGAPASAATEVSGATARERSRSKDRPPAAAPPGDDDDSPAG